ncbi:tsukushi [Aphomia sociella]
MVFKVALLLICFQCYTAFSASVCDNECLCSYTSNNSNEDYLGEEINCSYKSEEILIKDYTLPSIVYSLDLTSSNLETIQRSALLHSNTLRELYLNRNNITEIAVTAFDLPELKVLDLSNNNLQHIDKEVFRNMNKLEYLNVANNKFTSVTGLALHHLNNLNEVLFDFNKLGPSMMEINVYDNRDLGLSDKIKSLSVRGVGLSTIADNFLTDMYDLRKLIISDNNILEIPELPTTLEYLDISNNPIRVISEEDFLNVPGLRELKLNNLLIKEVPAYTFSSLPTLLNLQLERNRNLTQFSSLAFGRDVLEDADDFIMEKLSLRGSRLSTLGEELIEPFGQLFQLDLQGNPWICDCRLLWVKKLQIQPKDYNHLRCAFPRPLHNSRLFELRDKYFTCGNTKRYIGLVISMFTFCISATTLTLWIFKCLPKRKNARNGILNNYVMYTARTFNIKP